jgi:hypothetical protein
VRVSAVADNTVRFLARNGGIMEASDLAEFAAELTKPLHVRYRGYDVYDPVKVGFQEPPERAVGRDGKMEQRYFLFDTRRRGEGNGGHLYGTSLLPEQKDQLIEYLKTL